MQQLSLYHRFNFMRRFDPFFPIFVVIAGYYSIGIAQVFFLESVFALSMMLSEIPTGYYSDHYSRVHCLLFGCWMFCLSCVLYITWQNFWCWTLANIACGIAYACFSGSDTALLYEWLHEDQNQSYMAHESQMQAWSRCAEGVSALLGACLLYLNPRLPIFALLASKLAMTADMYTLLRPSDKPMALPKDRLDPTKPRRSFITLCKVFMTQVRLGGGLSLLVCSSVLNCVTFVVFWILQAELVLLDTSFLITGLYWLVLFGCAALVSLGCGLLEKHLQRKTVLVQCALAVYALSLFLLVCTWLKPQAALWWLSGFAVTMGLKLPLFNLLINQKIARQHRATFHSVDSLVTRLLFSATMPITGILLTGDMKSWLWLGWMAFVLFGFLCALDFRKHHLIMDK